MPNRDKIPTHVLVMMCGGYEYFGSDLRSVLANSSIPSCTIDCNFGAERKRTVLGSRLVRNDVFTDAPFSYITAQVQGSAVQEEEEEENKVNVGANKKKRMPRSL
jgi:hypothetical protein